MKQNVQELDSSNYSDFVKDNDCLVVFYKSQCPNCKVLMKVMEKCSASHSEIKMAEVDSEKSGSILEALDITRVPSTLVYKNGKITARKAGVMKPIEMAALYYEN